MPALRTTIATDKIPEAGMVVEGSLPADWLKESLLVAYTAASDLEVQWEVQLVGDNILIRGTLRVTLAFQCSRSGDPDSLDLLVDVCELMQPAETHTVRLSDEIDPELMDRNEPYLFEAGSLDLEPLIREQLVLAQNPHPVSQEHLQSPGTTTAERPIWTSNSDAVDPRWAKLKDLKIN